LGEIVGADFDVLVIAVTPWLVVDVVTPVLVAVYKSPISVVVRPHS
jgi:hypothetical protein